MKLEKLFDFEIYQNEDVPMPGTTEGDLLISPTSGGKFDGEKLSGKLLPMGWGTTYSHGLENNISASMLMETDDGCQILMDMDALLDFAPEVEEKLMAGQNADPDGYYYKGIVTFKTGSEKYKWLERRYCVCECIIDDWTKVSMTVYMLV